MSASNPLAGKTAIVTGASSGIGRAIAEKLGAAGAHVFLAGRTPSAMEESRARIEKSGGRATVVAGDVRQPSHVQELVDRAMRDTGRLDVMVNNAGVSYPRPIVDGDPEEWRTMLETNVLALLVGCQAAVRAMRKCGAEGHVVNISSIAAQRADSGVYGSTKHAVNCISSTLRRELADPSMGSLSFGWDEIEIVWGATDAIAALQGRTIASVVETRGGDPLDTLLDLAIADGLRTNFAIRRRTSDDERAVIDPLLAHPLLMPGSSDGGAHLLTFCGADYTTRLLAEHVPDRLSIEQAVAKLTFAPAVSLGLGDRGLLRPGMAGDIVVFDPARVAVGAVEMRHDFPTGAARLVFGAEGYKATIVNGEPVVLDGEPTGALAGTVIRAPRD